MNFENLVVTHKSFGDGVVAKKEGKYITVVFESCEKVFVYPDIFEKFLAPKDEALMDQIRIDLDAAKSEKQKIIDKKNAENLRAMTHGIVIPGKEATTPDSEEEEMRFKNTESEEI